MSSSVQQLKLESAKFSLSCMTGSYKHAASAIQDDADMLWDDPSPVTPTNGSLNRVQQQEMGSALEQGVSGNGGPPIDGIDAASKALSDVIFQFMNVRFFPCCNLVHALMNCDNEQHRGDSQVGTLEEVTNPCSKQQAYAVHRGVGAVLQNDSEPPSDAVIRERLCKALAPNGAPLEDDDLEGPVEYIKQVDFLPCSICFFLAETCEL